MTTLLKTVLLKTRNIIEDREHTADSIIEDGILIIEDNIIDNTISDDNITEDNTLPRHHVLLCQQQKRQTNPWGAA